MYRWWNYWSFTIRSNISCCNENILQVIYLYIRKRDKKLSVCHVEDNISNHRNKSTKESIPNYDLEPKQDILSHPVYYYYLRQMLL